MESIKDMKEYVSDIVGKAVTGTFDTMFGREIASGASGDGAPPAENGMNISSHVRLTQGAALNVGFSFHFDEGLLAAIAEETYPEQARKIPMKMICEDMACAIANVVGSRVKAFLNGHGYDLSMNIPAPGADNDTGEGADESSYLSFTNASQPQQAAAVLVNIHLQEKRAG